MPRIINLTQHAASPEQIAAGVFEPADKKSVRDLLDFQELPSRAEIVSRATKLAQIAATSDASEAMIGGAGFFMSALENALLKYGVQYQHAFSQRESTEEVQPDGSTKKVAVFRHKGFVGAV